MMAKQTKIIKYVCFSSNASKSCRQEYARGIPKIREPEKNKQVQNLICIH